MLWGSLSVVLCTRCSQPLVVVSLMLSCVCVRIACTTTIHMCSTMQTNLHDMGYMSMQPTLPYHPGLMMFPWACG